MALYQPKVSLSWKYLEQAVAPASNLKIVWDVVVEVAPGEGLSFSRTSVWDTQIRLDIGGSRGTAFTEEWDAPFNVSYGLPWNLVNEEQIRTEIKLNGDIKVNTACFLNNEKKGENASTTVSGSAIAW
jgi:hypothetical protein